mgnify:FL=1
MDMVQVSFPDIPDFGEYFSEGQRLLNEDTDKSEDEKRAMIHQKIYTSLIKDYPYARYVLGTEATNAFAAITCHPSLKDLTTYQIEGFMDGNIVTKEILESELQSLILEEGRSAIFGPLLADFNGPTFLYIDIANRANALDFLKLILFQSKYPSTTAMNWEYIREANSENWDPVYLLRAKN